MGDEAIKKWFNQARETGFSNDQIIEKMKRVGWSENQINSALRNPSPQPSTEKSHATINPKPRVIIRDFIYSESSKKVRELKPAQGSAYNTHGEYTPGNFTVGSKIFSRAWEMIKEYWKQLISLSLIQVVLYILFFQLAKEEKLITFIIGYLVVIISAIFITLVMTVIISRRNPSISQAISESRSFFFKYLGTLVLSYLVISGGYLLLIVPGILMSLAFTTLPYIMINENIFGFRALGRAYAMARNFRGNIFGSLLILFLFNLLLFTGFFVIFLIILFAVSMLFTNLSASVSYVFAYSGPTFIYSLLPIFSLVYFSIIYRDLHHIRPPGTDIEIEEKGQKRSKIYIILGLLFSIYFIYSIITVYNNSGVINPFSLDVLKQNAEMKYDVSYSEYPFLYTPPSQFEAGSEMVLGDDYFINFNHYETNPKDNRRENINISLDADKEKSSKLDEKFEQSIYVYEYTYSDWTIIGKGTESIDGSTANYIEGNFTEYGNKNIYIKKMIYSKNGYILEITFSSLNKHRSKYQPLFENSLNTLKIK